MSICQEKQDINEAGSAGEEDEMENGKPGMFARMRSLFRGVFGSWVREKEQEKPEVVYEQAIAERVRQYRELKDAVAGILYMRNKLESEIADRRAEIGGSGNGLTGLVHRETGGNVPIGARRVRLTMIAELGAGQPDGYADNIFFAIVAR